jgi:hypothetical protein
MLTLNSTALYRTPFEDGGANNTVPIPISLCASIRRYMHIPPWPGRLGTWLTAGTAVAMEGTGATAQAAILPHTVRGPRTAGGHRYCVELGKLRTPTRWEATAVAAGIWHLVQVDGGWAGNVASSMAR